MTYLGTFWLGVLLGCIGGQLVLVGLWWGLKKQTVVRIERLWHWSQTQRSKE